LGISQYTHMATPIRSPFVLRPHALDANFSTETDRFHDLAIELLDELEALVVTVNEQWPAPLDQRLKQSEATPELWALARRRYLLSDSVRIFSAVAIEGFLNFYGVLRIGESDFNAHFERLGMVPKLRQLLLVCDSVSIATTDPLVKSLAFVAEGRNALVHPKAKELRGNLSDHLKHGELLPEAAREAVAEMRTFFREFSSLVPKARHLIPK